MTNLSFTWSVGSPVIWTGYDNKRCIVRSAPGIWDGTDYVWFLSETSSMDFAFPVREKDFRMITANDMQFSLLQ